MIRPHPDPFTVSNLRRHGRQRTLAVMVAFAGTVACRSESTTGPRSPDLAAPPTAKQLTVPNSVSLVTQVQVDATKAEVENSRIGVNDMNYEAYTGAPEIASLYTSYTPPGYVEPPPLSEPPSYKPPPSGCTAVIGCRVAYSVQMPGFAPPATRTPARMSSSRRPATKPAFLWATNDCPIGQVCSTTDRCTEYRNQLRTLRGDYDRAYAEFWENLTVNFYRFPMNWINGGPVDIMRYKFQQMYFVALAARTQGCTRPPRGGYTTP